MREILCDKSCDTLPHDELMYQLSLAQAGSVEARNRVVASMTRLVIQKANHWAAVTGREDMRDDLVTAATCGYNGRGGLIRAVGKFNASKGKWHSFALNEIDLAMSGVMSAAMSDGQSRYKVNRLNGIRRVAERIEAIIGRQPSIEEVQQDYSERGRQIPKADRIHAALTQYKVSDEEASTETDLDAAIDATNAATELHEEIDKLPGQERVVMQRVLCEESMADIAAALGITKERVSAIHKSAVARLRHRLG